MCKEVADKFVEALHKLEDERDIEALVEIHTDDCDAGHAALEWNTSGDANGNPGPCPRHCQPVSQGARPRKLTS